MKNFLRNKKKACPQCIKHNFCRRGISLIEVIIVMAIIAILVAVIVPQFSKIKKAQLLSNATQNIFTTLNKAKSQTMSSLYASEFGVYFGTNKITLFKGTSYINGDGFNEDVGIDSPAYITWNFNGSNSLYFDRLNGDPNVSGWVTVHLTGESQIKTITVSSTGAINID